MNKKEAIKCMLDGKKVSHENADTKEYWFYTDDKGFRYSGQSDDNDVNTFVENGWEIHTEPKRKRKRHSGVRGI